MHKKLKPNLPMQVAILFGLVYALGHKIPLTLKVMSYTLSALMNEILVFILPFIVFTCMFNTVKLQKGKALKFLMILFTLTSCSNYVSSVYGYFVGRYAIEQKIINVSKHTKTLHSALKPNYILNLPSVTHPLIALGLGLGLGMIQMHRSSSLVHKALQGLNFLVDFFLKKLFLPLLPLFALGFILQMEHRGLLQQMLSNYLNVLLVISFSIAAYVFVLFGLSSQFKLKPWLKRFNNALPSALMGFSTMSSLATMPLTLEAAEKNLPNPALARSIIPATVNVHLIGNSIATPIMALTVLATAKVALPGLSTYLLFSLYFVANKFAVAAIPGGSILVMVPLLSQYLGLDAQASELMATLYIIVDPLITAGNVLGNGGFVTCIAFWMKKKP